MKIGNGRPSWQVAGPREAAEERQGVERPGPFSEVQLMWSRDGSTFELSPATFLPPGPERAGSWTYSDNVAWHLVETASDLEGTARNSRCMPRSSTSAMSGSSLHAAARRFCVDPRADRRWRAGHAAADLQGLAALDELRFFRVRFAAVKFRMPTANRYPASRSTTTSNSMATPSPGMPFGKTTRISARSQANQSLRFVMRDADLYSIKFAGAG